MKPNVLSAFRPPAPMPHISEHPGMVEINTKLAKFQERLAAARVREQRARGVAGAIGPVKRTAIESAELLASGGVIPSAEPSAEARAAEAEARILEEAIRDLTAQRDDLASRLSFDASREAADRNKAAMIRLDTAAGEVHAALSALRKLHADLQEAGYSPNQTVLPTHIPLVLYQVGDPGNPNTPAAALRRFVTKHFGRA